MGDPQHLSITLSEQEWQEILIALHDRATTLRQEVRTQPGSVVSKIAAVQLQRLTGGAQWIASELGETF